MKSINMLSIGLLVAVSSTGAFASGFRCTSENGFAVKLYNHTTGATRTPSLLVVSHGDADPSTLLTRKGSEIRKNNRVNSVQYVVEGNRKIDADTVILQVSYKEGRENLEAGETVNGQLILVSDGNRQVVKLECERYLKGE